jgi:uncharacterized MAPEG superfamily protein
LVENNDARNAVLRAGVSMARLGRALGILVFYPALLAASAVVVAGLLRRNTIDRQVVAHLAPYLEEVHIMYFAIAVLYVLTYTALPFGVSALMALTLNEPLNLKSPRLQRQRLAGLSGRLHGAQQNLVEGFAGFLGAVFSATFCKVSPTIRVQLALLHVVSRILYVLFYAMGTEVLRAFAWSLGTACCYALFGYAFVPHFAGKVEAFGNSSAVIASSLPIESLFARVLARARRLMPNK